MEFNYATERNKFEKNWAKTEAFYRKHGMTEEAIQEMREYDWNLFKAARIEAMHTQEMPATDDADEESGIAESPMVKRYFDRFTTEYDTYGTHSRHWWVQEIDCEPVAAFLPTRNHLEIEMLTMYLFEGFTCQEIAERIGKSRRSVNRYVDALITEIRRLYVHNLTKSSFQ